MATPTHCKRCHKPCPPTDFINTHGNVTTSCRPCLEKDKGYKEGAKTRRTAMMSEPPFSSATGPRCPFTDRDYTTLHETPVFGDSGEALEGITRLNDGISGVSFGLLFRGFAEDGIDVIWCNVCTARHEQGAGTRDKALEDDEEDDTGVEEEGGTAEDEQGAGTRDKALEDDEEDDTGAEEEDGTAEDDKTEGEDEDDVMVGEEEGGTVEDDKTEGEDEDDVMVGRRR